MPEPASAYPLREKAADSLRAHSGRLLHEITADAIAAGELDADDLRAHADTLRRQAEIAREHGFPQLAANLSRAAELSDVPNEVLLRIYDTLRPERASYDELLRLADYLEETYAAADNAAFIREAAEVYRERGLLRTPSIPPTSPGEGGDPPMRRARQRGRFTESALQDARNERREEDR